jgi:hypothetical protein
VRAAAAQRIGIFLDVPVNHTAREVELGPVGLRAWGNAASSETTQLRTVEARVFSRSGEYDLRATGAARKATETRLNEVFAGFDADLTAEPDLTNPDKDRITGEIIAELQTRVARKYGGPFGGPKEEGRSIGESG